MRLASTCILKAQRGYLVYRYANDDPHININEFIEDQLSSEDSGQVVAKHIKKASAEYQDHRMPKAFEHIFDSDDTKRKQDEFP
eukprot:4290425-Pyramimonas_sp.AAC.1